MKAVETLRREGYDGALCLIGDEPCAPYQRPPLSKAFLKGETSMERLLLTSETYFAEHKVDTMFGRRVQAIDVNARAVDVGREQRLSYSKLLLATGSRARSLDIPGSGLEGVHSLRTIDDARQLSAAATSGAARIAIIGGGYIGLEVAASMRACRHDVTIIESADRFLKRVVCPEVSDFFEDLHQRNGVKILKGARPERILGERHVCGMELANGAIIACDIVLIGIGSIPETDIAAASGIVTDNGIKVDQSCRTSASDVYAAGDCTLFPSRRYGGFVRLESVQNAIDQGKAAAHAMLGGAISYDPVPWFWSDQYNVKLQIAGLSRGYERVEVERGEQPDSLVATYFRDGRMIGVDAVNQPRAYLKARRALEAENPSS